jgi:hypothetical protein
MCVSTELFLYINYKSITTAHSAFLLLASCLSYSSTLKMEALCSPEMLVNFYRTRGSHIPEGGAFHF